MPMDTGDDISMDTGDDTGGDDLELADIGESGLPLILEKKNNNNRLQLDKSSESLDSVAEKLDSLLKD